MEPGKIVTETEAEYVRLVEEVTSKRKTENIISWAKSAGIKLPATTRSSSPIGELRSWVVGALARGATFINSPSSSASTETNVEVLTSLKELHAKVDTCTALQTKVAELERSQEFLNAELEDLKKLSQAARPSRSEVLQQQKRAVALPSASCRARCHCHLGHGRERDRDRNH